MEKPLVGILMGSESDLPVMEKAAAVLREMGVSYEIDISSAHRLPEKTVHYAKTARTRGLEVVISGAGMAAHLAGVLAAHTTLPVIGVPIAGKFLKGIDSLYSIVQMPSGVPVATVAIDGARNAGLLAMQILAVADPGLQQKYLEFKSRLADESRAKNRNLVL